MIGRPPFPHQPHLLSAGFLGEALGREVVAVEATELGASKGMLGSLALLDLTYAPGETGPARIVAKCAADRQGSLDSAKRGGTHERELRFYDELGSATPARIPEVYGSWYDPETAHFLLLQEFVEADAAVDQLGSLTLGQAELLIREMARLHARWFGDETLRSRSWLPDLDSPQRRTNLGALAGVGWAALRPLLDAPITARDESIGEALGDHIARMLNDVGVLAPTLLHSDLRTDNLLFAASGAEVVMIDWQGCCVGPGSFDLAYFLSQSLSVDDRRAHEAQLLDLYVAQLEALGDPRPRSEILRGYGRSMLDGLVIACAIPIVGDPNEPRAAALACTMAERAFAAIDDWGSTAASTEHLERS